MTIDERSTLASIEDDALHATGNPDVAQPPASASLVTLFGLVLARQPAEAEAAALKGRMLPHVAAELIASREFAVLTAEPVFDGSYDGAAQAMQAAEQVAIEAAFGLQANPRQRRLILLARVVECRAVAALLGVADVPWSVVAMAAALRRAAGRHDGFLEARVSPIEVVGGMARGLKIVALSGFRASPRAGDLLLDAGSCFVLFSLADGPGRDGDVCRIDFGLQSAARTVRVSLAVDYGDGFDARHVLALEPRGRSRYAAFIAEPRTVAMLRWDIEAPGSARLLLLTARGLPATGAQHGADARPAPAGAPLPPLHPADPEAEAFRLSRRLTRDLGGHRAAGRDYREWIERAPAPAEAPAASDLTFSLVLTVGGEGAEGLFRTVAGLKAQTHRRWVLSVVGSLRPGTTPEAVESLDQRVSYRSDGFAGGEDLLPSLVRDGAPDDWLATLRPGDVFPPHALARLASRIDGAAAARVVYADHDELDETGARSNPAFKPDFAPETLLGFDYMARPTFVRRDQLRAVGGWRDLPVDVADHDLKLRLTRRAGPDTVLHVPEVLLHQAPGTVRDGPSTEAAQRIEVLKSHLAATGFTADVRACGTTGSHVTPRPRTPPFVTIVIPTRDRADLLRMSVGSILRATASGAYEILVIDNGSVETDTRVLFESWREEPRVRVLEYPRPFNYSELNNFAVEHARGDVIGLVNNDIEVMSPHWIDELSGWAAKPEIGCVGAKLLYPDGRIQHAGVVVGIGGVAAHSHKFHAREAEGYGRRLVLTHNVSAVTAACLFVRRAVYEAVGGFEQRLAVAFNDVDFCLKVLDAGYRNLMCPSVELLHHESTSRGADDTTGKAARFEGEIAFMKNKWGRRLQGDAFYSPNLTRVFEDFSLDWSAWQ